MPKDIFVLEFIHRVEFNKIFARSRSCVISSQRCGNVWARSFMPKTENRPQPPDLYY
jgi:hypothetical protein